MAHNVFRKGKGGIFAVASVPHSPTPCLCSLVIKANESHQQATVELRFSVPLRGFDNEQHISLIYNADNLVPGETTLNRAISSLPWSMVQKIVRNNGKDLRSLSLTLLKPCIVRIPQSVGSLTPQNGFVDFQQIEDLAKTTKLDILFDYSWLHPSRSAQFLNLVNYTKQLSAFPRSNARNQYRETDWTVFSPGEEAPEASSSFADASLESPRRLRSSSPQAPTPKCVLLDRAIKFPPGSPTEETTTITATPSPRLVPSTPLALNPIQEAAETAILPDMLPGALQTILPDMLPGALKAILPDMLTRLLAGPASFSSSSQTPPPAPPNSMPFHNLILQHLTAHTESLGEEMTSHAADLRNTIDVELQEQLDDHRVDIISLKEDELTNMIMIYDEKLQELQEHTAELLEGFESDTLDAYYVMKDRLVKLVRKQRMKLVKEVLKLKPVQQRQRRVRFKGQPKRPRSVPMKGGM